jgi:glycosyltransferase involved in cell wall biosynthesis
MDAPLPSWQALRARLGDGGAAFAFVIPVYNHVRNVRQVVLAAVDCGAPVVVVDDGSTDGSGDAVDQIRGVQVVHHAQNRGKGAAILTGLAAVATPPVGARFAVTVDADGQHHPDDARRLLAVLCPDGEPGLHTGIVLGARLGMQGRAVPWSSRMGRGFSGFWVWTSGGPALSDSQSGFRVYPVAETLALPTRARRFEFEVEVLVQARRAGIPILEVPVPVTYEPPGGRVSHFRPWRDFGRNAATFTRLIATRFLPRRQRPRQHPKDRSDEA